jgi:hypothetical protein
MSDSISSLRAEFEAAVHELRQQLQDQQNCPTARPKPILPDPEKFNGIALKFDTWHAAILAKLRVDYEALGDDIARFYYVYLNLDSSVQAMVLPQLAAAEASQEWDYMTILEQLKRVYNNPNKVHEAEDRLLGLRQGSEESLPAFVAKFERCLYEAHGQNWTEAAKISALRRRLTSFTAHRR